MAHRSALVSGASLVFSLGVLSLAAAGCQQPSSSAEMLPAPSFNPPAVALQRPAPVAPAPLIEVGPPPAPRPHPLPQVAHAAPAHPPLPRRQVAGGSAPAAWVPNAPARPWKWIVIHHTATAFGNEAIVNRWHLDRGFDEMGYHFLIGNGTNSGDGEVEVGPRWPKQKWGAHTKTPDNRFNDYGIGICLVGNFDVGRPTPAQMRSVEKLVAYLMKTYHIPAQNVLGHGDCKSTDCPGRNLSVAEVRRGAGQILVDGGESVGEPSRLASSDELIHDEVAK